MAWEVDIQSELPFDEMEEGGRVELLEEVDVQDELSEEAQALAI